MKKLLKKILSLITSHSDKVLHAVISFGVMLAVGMFFPMWVAVAVTVILGAGKELADEYILKTGWDIRDVIADAVGLVAALVFLIVREVLL